LKRKVSNKWEEVGRERRLTQLLRTLLASDAILKASLAHPAKKREKKKKEEETN
jgi:hypothetical protein